MGRNVLGLAGAFAAGVFLVQQFPSLPDPFCLAFVPIAALFLHGAPGAPRLLLAALVGAAWGLLYAHAQLTEAHAILARGNDVIVTGHIGPEVRQYPGALRFVMFTDAVAGQPLDAGLDLRWYAASQSPRPGERWQLRVRTRPLSARFNPGGFDRVARSFRRGIAARGYVRAGAENMRLAVATPGLDALRAHLAQWVEDTLGERTSTGLVKALGLGERSGISTAQWQVLRNTGTAHLMAISGLHVGLVAGLGFAAGLVVWRRTGRLAERIAAQRIAAIAALLAALGYAALAGFSLPTQRALGMCAIAFAGVFLRQRAVTWHALVLTLALIAAWHPPSLTDPSLWLSAGAVAVLLFGMRGTHVNGRLAQLIKVQWVAALGLAPLGMLVFGYTSAISPLANIVAVPLVALLAVPLILLALVLSPWPVVAPALLELAATVLDLTWHWLSWCEDWQVPVRLGVEAEGYLVMMLVGVLLCLSQLPGRWVGVLWMLPAILAKPGAVPPGEFEATVLDVGQGLSVLVRTTNHALLYDTAGAFGSYSVAGSTITPALHRSGVFELDGLIVSHADLDHAGGARTVMRAFRPTMRLGKPRRRLERLFEPCRRGQAWHYDGVKFAVLHPPTRWRANRNNGSCVVRVSSRSGQHLLLTGDIEGLAERRLLADARQPLQAEVLVVPHHGSRTSSTSQFVQAVAPQLAVVSAGLRNRFGFPHEEIRSRYADLGVTVLNTATDGAVRIRSVGTDFSVTRFAVRQWRYWHFMTCDVASAKLAAAYAFRVGARGCLN